LLQREPPAASGGGYEDAGPYPLRAWRLARVLSALPPPRACPTQLLGAFVGDCRPTIWIARTQDV